MPALEDSRGGENENSHLYQRQRHVRGVLLPHQTGHDGEVAHDSDTGEKGNAEKVERVSLSKVNIYIGSVAAACSAAGRMSAFERLAAAVATGKTPSATATSGPFQHLKRPD